MSAKRGKWGDVPHAHEVLHHELVEGLGRVGHVNFSWSVSEIGLQVGGFSYRHRGVGGYAPSP